MSVQERNELDSYSDLHVQEILHTMTFHSSADAGPDAALNPFAEPEAVQSFEVLGAGRGLDNDEVAELVAFYRTSAAHQHGTGGPTQTVGELWANISLGVNLTLQDHAIDAANDPDIAVNFDIDDSGQTDFSLDAHNHDERGQFDWFQIAASPPFNDTTSGSGGAGSAGMLDRFVNYKKDLFGGPIVDPNDDLEIAAHMSVQGINSMTVDTYYQLFWNVQQLETLRPEFGRPI